MKINSKQRIQRNMKNSFCKKDNKMNVYNICLMFCICILNGNTIYSQTNNNLLSNEIYSERSINLFNPADISFLESQKNGNYTKSQINKLGNDWFIVENNKILLKKDKMLFLSKGEYNFILLNDSIIKKSDNILFNIYTGENYNAIKYFSDSNLKLLTKKNSYQSVTTQKMADEMSFEASTQGLTILNSDPLVSDILETNIREIVNTDKHIILHNILKTGVLFGGDELTTDIVNNKFSNYILFPNGPFLINRYNLGDKIDIPKIGISNGMKKSISFCNYNDSLIIISAPFSSTNKFINVAFNKFVNIKFEEFFTSSFSFDQEFFDKYQEISHNNIIETMYLFKKYSNVDISSLNKVEILNYITAYNNIIKDITPNLVIIFNYKTQKITSILDRCFKPFGEISKLLVDKTNSILFVQSSDEYFTIFDLNTRKEIITLRGTINNIDSNNNLILNVISEFNEKLRAFTNYPKRINALAINLNDFYLKNQFYTSPPTEKFSIDEFTSRLSFDNFVNKKRISDLEGFKLQKLNISNSKILPANIIYKVSNSNFIGSYKSLVENYCNIITSNAKEIGIPLLYSNFELDGNKLILQTDTLESEGTLELLGNFSAESTKDYPFSISIRQMKNFSTLTVNSFKPEVAKQIKEGSVKVKIILMRNMDRVIPAYTRIFVQRNFDAFKEYILGSADEYYEKYVPVKNPPVNSLMLEIDGNKSNRIKLK